MIVVFAKGNLKHFQRWLKTVKSCDQSFFKVVSTGIFMFQQSEDDIGGRIFLSHFFFLTTGMVEVFSDFLVKTIPPAIAALLALLALIGSLTLQFKLRRYIAWVYWLAVVMVSVFGTMAADVLHAGLGIPYIVSTTFVNVSDKMKGNGN